MFAPAAGCPSLHLVVVVGAAGGGKSAQNRGGGSLVGKHAYARAHRREAVRGRVVIARKAAASEAGAGRTSSSSSALGIHGCCTLFGFFLCVCGGRVRTCAHVAGQKLGRAVKNLEKNSLGCLPRGAMSAGGKGSSCWGGGGDRAKGAAV